jgi:hypothetical protein
LEARVRHDFAPAAAKTVLGRLASLNPALAQNQSRERIQAAVVLLGEGDLGKFERAATLAEVDWRDALVAGGRANGDWPIRLDEELGPK